MEINSRWEHKDGGIYEVTEKKIIMQKEPIIFYRLFDTDREFCRTMSDFLQNFTEFVPPWHNNKDNYPARVVVTKGVDKGLQFNVISKGVNNRFLIESSDKTISVRNCRLATIEELNSIYCEDS